ncbi:MAG: c-type cytochrome [Nitrospinae bacterium]|nr:c-type cytochrome [Nitrospinota bacterium]
MKGRWQAILLAAGIMAAGSFGSARAADIAEGKRLYRVHCESCHGERGQPEMPGAANFSKGEGLMKTDAQLRTHMTNGGRMCPSFAGVIMDRGMFDLALFLRTLF